MIIPLGELPGTSALARTFCSTYDKVSAFFNGDYTKPDVYAKQAELVLATPRADRQAVVSVLEEQNRRFGAGPATLTQIKKLQQADSLVVATGQQVGLCTGPAYTIYKALTCCRLARELERLLQKPVIPIFYLVTEDHDFEEVRWLGVLNADHSYEKLYYTPSQPPERIPMAQVILEQTIEQTRTRFAAYFKPEDEIWQQVSTCYREGVSLSHAFARLFLYLLRDYGVVVLDPSDARFKQLALPILQTELTTAPSISAMLKTNTSLSQQGFHSQLAVHPQRPHLFILENGRHSLEKQGDGWANMHSGTVHSSEELLEEVHKLSPKAAIRPIVQDWLLPTIAYVGGPGEVSYLAQLKGVYEAHKLPMPVVVPRAGFTLMEPRLARYLDKLGLTARDFICEHSIALADVQRQLVPAQITDHVQHIRQCLAGHWPDLAAAITTLDPTLQTPVQKTENQILSGLEQLEAKVLRSMKQKESVIADQLQAVQNGFLPADELQERKVNLLPFLAKYPGLIATLFEAIQPMQPAHHVIAL
jgi:bacillithiol biosynthesis cysteine-adding enzyme BshC